ncbi:hypothetical protein GOV04_04515 [Candidatus Woesearchaeota archaeon]|nr:hypothetical protein [Candidatus Woesearchaeota archaeon]
MVLKKWLHDFDDLTKEYRFWYALLFALVIVLIQKWFELFEVYFVWFLEKFTIIESSGIVFLSKFIFTLLFTIVVTVISIKVIYLNDKKLLLDKIKK